MGRTQTASQTSRPVTSATMIINAKRAAPDSISFNHSKSSFLAGNAAYLKSYYNPKDNNSVSDNFESTDIEAAPRKFPPVTRESDRAPSNSRNKKVGMKKLRARPKLEKLEPRSFDTNLLFKGHDQQLNNVFAPSFFSTTSTMTPYGTDHSQFNYRFDSYQVSVSPILTDIRGLTKPK